MTAEDRLAQLDAQIQAVAHVWPVLLPLVQARMAAHVVSLIGANDEQTRGRIKALTEILELPVALQQERDGIEAGLAEQAPAQAKRD
jgi:hypothetical protein